MTSTSRYDIGQGYTKNVSLGDQLKNDNSTEQLYYDEPMKQMRTDQEHAEERGSSPKMHNLSPPPFGDIDRGAFTNQRPPPRDVASCGPCVERTDHE